MKILLSPAKKLDFSENLITNQVSHPIFKDKADSLAVKLHKTSFKKLGEMMHLSSALTELNKERYSQWNDAPQKSAALAFNGDVYLGLNASSWTENQLLEAQKSIRIISGLYGILKPLDLIKPYRLEMGSKWKVTPAKSNLYKYWGNKIAEALENELVTDEPILNLASAEYSKAILPHLKSNQNIITAEFKEFKNGEYKMIQIFVKKARGMMAKFVVQNKITEINQLVTFEEDGYQYDSNLSSNEKLVFTR